MKRKLFPRLSALALAFVTLCALLPTAALAAPAELSVHIMAAKNTYDDGGTPHVSDAARAVDPDFTLRSNNAIASLLGTAYGSEGAWYAVTGAASGALTRTATNVTTAEVTDGGYVLLYYNTGNAVPVWDDLTPLITAPNPVRTQEERLDDMGDTEKRDPPPPASGWPDKHPDVTPHPVVAPGAGLLLPGGDSVGGRPRDCPRANVHTRRNRRDVLPPARRGKTAVREGGPMKRRWGAEVAAALVVCALAVTFAIDNGRFAIGHVGTPPEAAETSAPSVEPSAGPPSAAAVNPESPPGETPEPSPAETGPWETPGAVPVTGEPPAETANAAETPAIQTPAPEPTTPTPTPPGESALTRTLSVRCDTLLGRLDALDPEKRELVPPDGVIFPAATVTFREGESVFNLLRRELRRAGVHLEFTGAPLYGSAYIEGIHNLYALDAGELSGWMYKVGGVFPSCGCSLCLLRDGDTVEWVYTCDLGRDVGAPSGGGQWGA